MGKYLNPGNRGFERISKTGYVDKTGMIELINKRIDTSDNLICISRPRRFGKSYAARMLCAYYDHTCDSHSLFDDKAIGKSVDYEDHINKYNVIYLDISGIISKMATSDIPLRNIAGTIKKLINKEIRDSFPNLPEYEDASDSILALVSETNKMVVFIIDEWDAVIREAKDDNTTQKVYLDLLREWFKNGNFTDDVVAAAYMTGILPIKKDKSQSAISDFDEGTVLQPGDFSSFIGFTEDEVRKLCDSFDMSFDEAKHWYDGYAFSDVQSIYNPYSIMRAMRNRVFQSYWQHTSAAENLETLININKDGLQEDILKLIAGEQIVVNTKKV